MKSPEITVLIDTYNYGQYIEEAIESALTQDFPADRLEIIVVDDGSTDDTEQRVKKYENRIQYLSKRNGGQASAFNLGMECARGEIVAFLDADDVWLPGKLKTVAEAFINNPELGLMYHRALVWKGLDETSPDTIFVPVTGYIPDNFDALLRYPIISTSCLAFRQEALKSLLPIPTALRSQADAYLTALIIFVAPVMAVGEFLTKYRIHGGNLFQGDRQSVSRDRLEHRMAMRKVLLESVRDWLTRNGHDVESHKLQSYLKQWSKAQEVDSYALRAPTRWQYFRHLVEYPRIYGGIMSSRHRLYSYIQAVSALFLGYHHLHVVDDLRARYKGLAGSSKNSGADETKSTVAKG